MAEVTIEPDEVHLTCKQKNAILRCSAEGITDPQYKWRMGDTPIDGSDTRYQINQNELFIKDVQSEEQVKYTCVVPYNNTEAKQATATLFPPSGCSNVEDSTAGSNTGLTIGIVVVILLLLLIFVVACFVIWKRRQILPWCLGKFQNIRTRLGQHNSGHEAVSTSEPGVRYTDVQGSQDEANATTPMLSPPRVEEITSNNAPVPQSVVTDGAAPEDAQQGSTEPPPQLQNGQGDENGDATGNADISEPGPVQNVESHDENASGSQNIDDNPSTQIDPTGSPQSEITQNFQPQ